MKDAVRQAWRELVSETAIEPAVPIIDAHHHLFAVAPRPNLEPCTPNEWISELRASNHNVVATVHVDAFSNYRTEGPEHLRPVGETEYIESVANASDQSSVGYRGVCSAIVCNADLMLGGAVGEVIDAHMTASARVRNVRRMTVYDAELPHGLPGHRVPHMLGRPEFHEGMREVAKRGLGFDAAVAQSQLLELVDFAHSFSDTLIVLNHIGTPLAIGRYRDNPADAFAQWKAGMVALARCPNVVVKIGGLNMPFTGLGVDPSAATPLTSSQMADRQRVHVLTTIELFGPHRCMFESNFPVDQWYTSYRVLWNAFKIITTGFSTADRSALFSETARRVYRMTEAA